MCCLWNMEPPVTVHETQSSAHDFHICLLRLLKEGAAHENIPDSGFRNLNKIF